MNLTCRSLFAWRRTVPKTCCNIASRTLTLVTQNISIFLEILSNKQNHENFEENRCDKNNFLNNSSSRGIQVHPLCCLVYNMLYWLHIRVRILIYLMPKNNDLTLILSHCKLQITHHRLQISYCSFQILNCILQFAELYLQIAGFSLQMAISQLQFLYCSFQIVVSWL